MHVVRALNVRMIEGRLVAELVGEALVAIVFASSVLLFTPASTHAFGLGVAVGSFGSGASGRIHAAIQRCRDRKERIPT